MEINNNDIYNISHISISEDEHKIIEKQRNNKSTKTTNKNISDKFNCSITDSEIKKLIVMSIKHKRLLAQKETESYNNQKENNHSQKRLINKLKLTPFQIYQKFKDNYLKQKMNIIFENTNQAINDSSILDKTNLLDKHLKFLQYKKKEKLNKLILTNFNPLKVNKNIKHFNNNKKEKQKKVYKVVKNYLITNKTKDVLDLSKKIEIRNINPNNFSNTNYCSIFSNDKIKKHISFFENSNKKFKNYNSFHNYPKQIYLNAYTHKSFSLDFAKIDKTKLPGLSDQKIRGTRIPLYNITAKKH